MRLPTYMPAESIGARKSMQENRSSDTRPELAVRKRLHALGLRFRKNYRIERDGIRVSADIAFLGKRIAVFIDGCYWHGCPSHCRIPSRNREYWSAKIKRNIDRDRRVNDRLTDDDWLVLRYWEHEPVDEVAGDVAAKSENRHAAVLGGGR